MRKPLRLLFCVFALLACFQLVGLQEAFCEDSALETGCTDCVTCVEHQFTGVAGPVLLPAMVFNGYTFLDYSFQPREIPPLNFLRPPIAR